MQWRIDWSWILLAATSTFCAPFAVTAQQQPTATRSAEASDQSAASADEAKRPQRAVRNDCPTLEELGYRRKPLVDISLDIRLKSEARPADCSQDLFVTDAPAGSQVMDRGDLVFYWAANELSYRPLYFEDPLLERYGQVDLGKLQPAVSGVRFLGSIAMLPYKMTLDPPFSRVYPLGHYRPGSAVPELRYRLPWEWDAALVEVGTWAGLMLLLP
ncbi:MAG: hypothetical protein CMJ75_01920 [Planctomycetaceae bacterium]|nr:hypothetical protein [Planctomycetaceae bacterium]